ncbi:MAG: DUF1295 domain-containing protein [Treponemataceae bacterium]|nr:DUF1295 domain-containing protein [Treponemataceae bacterium]
MKTPLLATVIGLSVIACPILYFLVGPVLQPAQIETLKILLTVVACSALYCFIVGELSGNYSQMDKLWSILPEVYTWIIAVQSGFQIRLIIIAAIATFWGGRLTYNFAKKGAYSIRFWAGEEDYRWKYLRERKEFQPHWKWFIFNFFFISIYQNVLIFLTTLPALVSMNSDAPLNWIDILATVIMTGAVVWETVADKQQWAFQSKKYELLNEGKKLEELPEPYNKGFNTTGLWKRSRHPNYLGEQMTWIGCYIFSIAAGIGIFNWSIIGALLLVALFLGSSTMAEMISKTKYPEYQNYVKSVPRYFPGKPYN